MGNSVDIPIPILTICCARFSAIDRYFLGSLNASTNPSRPSGI